MINIAVLASGRGTDFQSIIDGVESGRVDAKIVILITDNPDAKALKRAEDHGIPKKVIDPKDYADRLEHDRGIMKELNSLNVDLVVLAGYMRIIKDKGLLGSYRGKMINIHPSLLPAFPGAHAQKDAFEYGTIVSGYTIHFVDDSLDGGAVIYQEAVDISDCSTGEEVSLKILEREHIGLPLVVDSFSKGKYEINGRKVSYKKY